MSGASVTTFASPELTINQQLWLEFSDSEHIAIISKFPQIEVIPSDTVGIIQSVQIVNRSSPGTNSGASLGGALGQTLYIDSAFRGSGTNYSSTAQLGAAILGAAIGSSLDSAPQIRYVFNYAVKTVDGQIREIRVGSSEEFTRPVGQCVFIPSIAEAPVSLCNMDKVRFLKRLSALSHVPSGTIISDESTGIYVNCRVPEVGLMRLEKKICIQIEGGIEK